eukprot:scaffold35167_cov61-Attheya_sp.AAC.2
MSDSQDDGSHSVDISGRRDDSSSSEYNSSSESDGEGSDTQLIPSIAAARNPAASSSAEFLDDPRILSSCRLSIKDLEPTPSMKLGYKRLRDRHRWMELPPNPPCILLRYKLESEKQAELPRWKYERLGVGPLVHGYIECYNTESLWVAEIIGFRRAYSTDTFLYLKDAPLSIPNNRTFMMIALHMTPRSLRWAGPNVLECLHLVTYAVCKDSLSLAYAPLHLKKNKEFVKLACSVKDAPTPSKLYTDSTTTDNISPTFTSIWNLLKSTHDVNIGTSTEIRV